MTPKNGLSVPQEFMTTILNDKAGYFYQVEGWTLNCAIVGAVLADLSLKSRIDTDEEVTIVLDPSKTGDPVLDLCLTEIASSPEPKEPRYWIERLAIHSEDIVEATVKNLVQLNVWTSHVGGFYTTNHCDWHAELEEYPKSESVGKYINSRIEKVLFTGIIPDPRDAFIIGLLNACDIIGLIFDDLSEERKQRIELICNLETFIRVISTTVKQVAVAPTLQYSPITKPIPKIPLTSIIANRHLWDGNLPALFGSLASRYGPVFQIGVPFQKPKTFLAGPTANHWVRRNSRKFMTSGSYFREMEMACGANNLLPSLDGAEHFRLRKLMVNVYSNARFYERLDDMLRLSRQFMADKEWRVGSEVAVQRESRLLTNFQMFNILLSTDAQDLFEDLVEWNERAITCYVAEFMPRVMVHTPAMKRRFRAYNELLRRIEENHIPIRRAGVPQELADELISLHNSDPQFIPEQNLLFMLAATPIFQSLYLGDMLGFIFFEMARQPDISARIREEANVLFDNGDPGKDDLIPEKYDVTRRFLMECLRMYPVIAASLRNVANSCVVEDYSLPLREKLYIVHSASHYMSSCFSEPYKFDIDRYLSPRREHQGAGYAPFGLDAHSCAGRAWMHLHLVVTTLIVAYYFQFEPVPSDYKLRIDPVPALSVTKKLKLRTARQWHDLPA